VAVVPGSYSPAPVMTPFVGVDIEGLAGLPRLQGSRSR
jgi:hypothetical protein